MNECIYDSGGHNVFISMVKVCAWKGNERSMWDVQIPLSALEQKYFFPFCWLVMLLRGILVGPEHTCLYFDVDPVPCSVWGGLFAP